MVVAADSLPMTYLGALEEGYFRSMISRGTGVNPSGALNCMEFPARDMGSAVKAADVIANIVISASFLFILICQNVECQS